MVASEIQATRLRLLQDAYRRLGADTHVAFVDESYVVPEVAHGGRTFYIATAYVSPVRLHEPVRRDLFEIVGGTYWHTNEAHGSGKARKIRELCEYLAEAEADESFLLAVKSPIEVMADGDERAREVCLTALLEALHRGDVSQRPSLVIAEERHHQRQRARDQRTVRSARRAQRIGQTQVLFTSPAVETLLWVPDIVSFAQNHKERGSNIGYVAPLEPLLRIISL